MSDLESIVFIHTHYPWVYALFVFILGACVGSFLNVCIYRLPARQSLLAPPSHNAQGDPIAWYDNIPLVSWFVLRGRDRKTGEPFTFRYVVVELLTAVLFLGCWLWLPWEQAVVGWVFCALLVVASFIDLDTMTLPDVLTVGGALLGVFLSCVFPMLHLENAQMGDFFDVVRAGGVSMFGVLIGSAVVLWILILGELILKKPAMGEGDIFLLGCIGAFCGWQGAVFALFGGSVIGVCVLIPLMFIERVFKIRILHAAAMDRSGGQDETVQAGVGSAVPFGPWLACGAVVYYLIGNVYFDPYLNRLIALWSEGAAHL